MTEGEEPPYGPERLGWKVVRRRHWLGITAAEAAVAAPMSPTTWSKIENGGGGTRSTYAAVERVLRWRPGSCQAVIEGGQPMLLDGGEPPLPARLRKVFEQLLDDPAVTDQVKASIRVQLGRDQESPGSAERTAG